MLVTFFPKKQWDGFRSRWSAMMWKCCQNTSDSKIMGLSRFQLFKKHWIKSQALRLSRSKIRRNFLDLEAIFAIKKYMKNKIPKEKKNFLRVRSVQLKSHWCSLECVGVLSSASKIIAFIKQSFYDAAR